MGASGHEPHRETELKLVVPSPEDLDAVAAAAARRGARIAPAARQHNRFFDAPDGRLRGRGATLRLRAEGERFLLTAKGPLEPAAGRDLHVRAEEEAWVDPATARAIAAGTADPLAVLGRALGRPSALLEGLRDALSGATPAAVWSFENERTRVGPLRAGAAEVALELDRSVFPGGVEVCEIELELPPDAVEDGRRLLDALLAEAGVRGRPGPSKAARFFAALAAERERGRGKG